MFLTTIINKTIQSISKEEFSDDKKISEETAWSIILLALVIRTAIVFTLVPLLWNESVKVLFNTKTKMTGRMALAFAVLLDFLV
tara:strand:+ start:4559 stop:4810 length:252 start_codon:yes stop_codon:yes gene_type:complete